MENLKIFLETKQDLIGRTTPSENQESLCAPATERRVSLPPVAAQSSLIRVTRLAAGSSRQSILSHQFITYPYCVAAGQFSRPGRRIGNALLLHVASICFIRLFGNRTRILGRELHYHMIIMRIAWLSNRDQPGHFGVIVDSVFILGNRTHFWDLMIILGTQAGHIGTFKFDSMSTQAVSSKYKYTTAIFSL